MEYSEGQRQKWREQKQAYRKARKEYILIFSDKEGKTVEGYADAKRMSVPEFIKAIIKSYSGNTEYILPKEAALKELVLELRRIGNNVNQIARYINNNKTITEVDILMLNRRILEMEQAITTALTNPQKCDHQIDSH